MAAIVLGSWALLFAYLRVSGRVGLFLGSRTAWLAPVAVIILGVTAIGVLMSARTTSSRGLERGEVLLAAILVLPVLLVAVSPRTSLGSFSAARKAPYTGSGGSGLWTYWGSFNDQSDITLFFVTAAKYWPQANALLAKRAGADVDFVGFVDGSATTPADEFILTRFVVTCCVADAAVATVRVVNVQPGLVAPDEWVEVKGQIYPVGTDIIVAATSITQVQPPAVPYLQP